MSVPFSVIIVLLLTACTGSQQLRGDLNGDNVVGYDDLFILVDNFGKTRNESIFSFKEGLGLAALVLSIVNGLTLLRQYQRDRPKLVVKAIHPDVYQWWFRFPDGEYENQPTRRFGFLIYIGILNKGLRRVSLDSWRLHIPVAWKSTPEEFRALSIPEPRMAIGESGAVKTWPVLGQSGLSFTGETLVEGGTSISGMVYYHAEFAGSEEYSPNIQNGLITVTFATNDVFGGKSVCKISLKEKPIDKIKEMIEGIEAIK